MPDHRQMFEAMAVADLASIRAKHTERHAGRFEDCAPCQHARQRVTERRDALEAKSVAQAIGGGR